MSAWPDFFIVGAPRSGTTAMATYLDRHPHVFCVPDGPHFYERDQRPDVETTVRDRDAYRALFEGTEGAERVGEKSVWYLRDPAAAKAIRADVPDADVLIQLRNPVEMVPSLHARRLERGDEHIRGLEEALDAEPNRRAGRRVAGNVAAPATLLYTDAARYARQVRRWIDVFGRDQVHVLLFEDLVEDPASAYDEVCASLGVETGRRPGFERVRPRRQVRSHRLQRLLWNPPDWLASVGDRLDGWAEAGIERLREWNLDGPGDRRIEPGTRARLEEVFRDDVRRLETVIDRDLSGWIPPE